MTFPRVPELDNFESIPAGASDRLTLDFHGIPGLEPANGYDMQGNTALDGPWSNLARLAPAGNGQATCRWNGSVPATSRRFLKITPAQ